MSKMAEPAGVSERRGLVTQVVPLSAAALVGPITLAVTELTGHELGAAGDVAVTVTAAFVFLLVVMRLVDVMTSQRRAHDALERKGVELRHAVEALRKTEQERARLFDEVVKAAEDERVRVAGELHDGPIQQLTALALTLDLTNIHLDRGDAAALKAALASARQNAADQMLELRRLMIELRPPALDEVGIEAALRDYTADFDRRGETRCLFKGEIGERRLGASLETTLYRVAQEALGNVEKHAKASTVRVLLTADSDSVRLRVEDDGVGFAEKPTSELIRTGHFGLVGMRDRVERAGGGWQTTSAPGAGTTVEATLPVVEQHTAARVEVANAGAA
jgi:signal transduction histidine kinase